MDPLITGIIATLDRAMLNMRELNSVAVLSEENDRWWADLYMELYRVTKKIERFRQRQQELKGD